MAHRSASFLNLLLCESQGYYWLGVFHLSVLYHSVGVNNIRLGSLTVEIEWIVKRGQGKRRLLVGEEPNGDQCRNGENNQDDDQTRVRTIARFTFAGLCRTTTRDKNV